MTSKIRDEYQRMIKEDAEMRKPSSGFQRNGKWVIIAIMALGVYFLIQEVEDLRIAGVTERSHIQQITPHQEVENWNRIKKFKEEDFSYAMGILNKNKKVPINTAIILETLVFAKKHNALPSQKGKKK